MNNDLCILFRNLFNDVWKHVVLAEEATCVHTCIIGWLDHKHDKKRLRKSKLSRFVVELFLIINQDINLSQQSLRLCCLSLSSMITKKMRNDFNSFLQSYNPYIVNKYLLNWALFYWKVPQTLSGFCLLCLSAIKNENHIQDYNLISFKIRFISYHTPNRKLKEFDRFVWV